jgi:hypothetical protein
LSCASAKQKKIKRWHKVTNLQLTTLPSSTQSYSDLFARYESRPQLRCRRNSDARGEVARARIELICPTRQISLHSVSLDDERPKNPLRVKFNLRSDFNVIWVVQSPRKKYFAGPVGQISATSSPRPFPARGAYRDRHERGRGCGGRGSVGAQVFAGRSSVSEHSAQDERRQSPAKPFGEDG